MATGEGYQVAAAQDDLDSGAWKVQAERAPGFGGNSDGSVARPDGAWGGER